MIMDNNEMSNGAKAMIQFAIILAIAIVLIVFGMILNSAITNDYSAALHIVGIEEDNRILSWMWSR